MNFITLAISKDTANGYRTFFPVNKFVHIMVIFVASHNYNFYPAQNLEIQRKLASF